MGRKWKREKRTKITTKIDTTVKEKDMDKDGKKRKAEGNMIRKLKIDEKKEEKETGKDIYRSEKRT